VNEGVTLPRLVQRFLQQFTTLWWRCDTCLPGLGPTYTTREKLAREAHLKRFLDTLTSELEQPPRTSSERYATQEHIFSAFGAFARSALDFKEPHLDVLRSRGFTQMAMEFAHAARRFDPTISASDILQATRNAWVMNGLQMLLGLPVGLTPAMTGYSLLYPYTDNYLDDPTIPEDAKTAFNERLARRLTGENISPINAQERAIYDLVGMIENQFDRSQYPDVFESLLAIHCGQARSLSLLRRDASPYEVDVLGISIEKGGASVLADGYLVAGSLTEAQAEFMFGYGAFLQIEDDLQDVHQDHKDGLLTVFSQTARRWPLDRVTSRTFHFGAKVLERLDCFDAPGLEPLKELMQRSAILLPIEAAGGAGHLFSRRYIRELEAHSPFRFSFLKKQRRKLARQRVSMMRLIEAYATANGAGSLMASSSGEGHTLVDRLAQ